MSLSAARRMTSTWRPMVQLVCGRFAEVAAGGKAPLDKYSRDILTSRLTRILETTVTDGKMLRGRLVLDSAKSLGALRDNDDTKPNLYDTLAWAVEMLQSFFLMYDDIMDGATVRRGRPAWHMQKGIGMSAVNDGFMLETALESTLAHVAAAHPAKQTLLAAVREVKQITSVGQLLDISTEGRVDTFDMQLYKTLVRCKTSHYSFYLPAQLALVAAQRHDLLARTKSVAYCLGEYFQAQDDFLDVYHSVTSGKTSGDIANGKCTWLACTALRMLDDQSEIALLREFKTNYGQQSDKCVNRILDIYDRLQMRSIFAQYEEEQRVILENMLEDNDFPLNSVFRNFVDILFGRTK